MHCAKVNPPLPGGVCQASGRISDDVHRENAAYRRCDCGQVVGIAGHDQVAACERGYDNHRVDQIARATLRERGAGSPCPGLSQRLHSAADQEPREFCLRTSSPDLTEHTCWHCRPLASYESTLVQGPHPGGIALTGDQRAGVVGDAAHSLWPTPAASSTASAAARSSALNSPVSASHSATAAKPLSIASSLRDASLSQADRLMPLRSAERRAA